MEKLLVIAPMVPLFDKQSGDLRFYTILSILSKSYDITYLARWATENPEENERYATCLRDMGIKVYIEKYSIKEIFRLNTFKAIFIEFYFMAEHYLPRIRILKPSIPVIVDSVDVHYLRLYRKYRISNDTEDLKKAELTKKRELDIYSQSDIVLTVTNEDGNILHGDNSEINVRILPNVHELVYPTSASNKNEIIFVGGFGHDPNIDAVVYFCEDILPKIRQVKKEVRFTIVGSNPPVQIRAFDGEFITVTGYVPSTTPYLQKSYISVAPLRYGAGMKGKIGEAMAHGLPVVTTSIGAEGMNLTNRENVMIADTPHDFTNSVLELMTDDKLHMKIQKNSLEYISKNYTPHVVANKMENILAELRDFPIKKWSLSSKTSFLINYALDIAKHKLNIPA